MPSKIKRARLKDQKDEVGGRARASAQQIWLAGIGAFSLAQQEGGKVFDALVDEGRKLDFGTRKAAEEQVDVIKSSAKDAKAKAAGNLDKLEQIFQDRVSRALKALGVPTHRELEDLMSRIDALTKNVEELKQKQG